MDNLEELLRLSGGDGQIFTVEGMLCMKSVQAMFGYDSGEIMEYYHVVMFSIFIRESLCIFVCLKEADRSCILPLPCCPALWEPFFRCSGVPST